MTKIQFPAGAEIFLFSITISRPVMGSHHAFQPVDIVEEDASHAMKWLMCQTKHLSVASAEVMCIRYVQTSLL